MEKVRPWRGQPSDRGRLRNRTEHTREHTRGRVPPHFSCTVVAHVKFFLGLIANSNRESLTPEFHTFLSAVESCKAANIVIITDYEQCLPMGTKWVGDCPPCHCQ